MKHKTVRIFGIPLDLGQNRRGVDMGPSAVRYAQLYEKIQSLGYEACDEGNIPVNQVEQLTNDDGYENAHFLPQIASVCQATYDRVNNRYQRDDFLLFLGGDHSMSIGTVSAAAAQGNCGVLWVDAHPDMNTPQTSPSGNIHGMSVAVLLGHGPDELVNVGTPGAKLRPEQIAMVGIRSVDLTERPLVKESGVCIHTMRDIDEQGIHTIGRKVLEQFEPFERIHVSFDLDSLDPRLAAGVGTPVMGGLKYREAHLLMEILSDSGKLTSMDLVEINPILDNGNRTAEIAVEMVLSGLGKQIL